MARKGQKYTIEELGQRTIIQKKWLETTEAGKKYKKSIDKYNIKVLEKYNEKPVLCKECNSPIEYSKRRNKFCNHSCAAQYSNARRPPITEEVKLKISIGVKNSELAKEAAKRKINNTPKFTIICHNEKCKKIIIVSGKSRSNKNYCNKNCYLTDENKKPGGQGGYRIGSGRGKYGWYKGYWCDSSYELAFVMFNIDNNILFERNKIGFEYLYEGKTHKFYPDFIVNGKYVEIKGYFTEQTITKIKQFPHSLEVIDTKKIQPYIKYAEEKYGKNFIELYEGNPHNEKHNKCKVCENPCKNVFCSQSCAGKERARIRHLTNKNNSIYSLIKMIENFIMKSKTI